MTTPATINETIEWVSAGTPPPNDNEVLICCPTASPTVSVGYWFSRRHQWMAADMAPCFEQVAYWAFLPIGPKQ